LRFEIELERYHTVLMT